MTLKKGDKVAFMVLGKMVEGNIRSLKEKKSYDNDIPHNKYLIEHGSKLYTRLDCELSEETEEFYSLLLDLKG